MASVYFNGLLHWKIGQVKFLKLSRKLQQQSYVTLLFAVSFCHVTYVFQSESTLYSCLNVKELLTQSRREICKRTRTHSYLIHKRTLNHSVFVYELSGCGFESSCSHLDFRFCACWSRQGVPWQFLAKWLSVDSLWNVCMTWQEHTVITNRLHWKLLVWLVSESQIYTSDLQT